MRKAVRQWLARSTGATAAALLLAGYTAGATHAADQHGHDMNITAHFAATVSADPDTVTCGGFDVTAQGRAAGTPIGGNGTWQDQEKACTLSLPGQYDINGTAVIGAGAGNTITLTYHLTAPLTENPVVHPSGTYLVIGGTGAYASATGGGRMNSVVNLKDTSHVTASLHGTLY
ncbi:hypothetical protein D9753_31015 [Streptomyces dangxiongensis]|uniref:Uncharacterized protein n=1 Tax=Streptomyces dangxiongensis TaxID=1442032 RepID=A0A3G2JJP5_9ACTN|nr:hypothetical protein [Streptomyces dangxiongensis]AYN42583.1 hypothetical protein D9753_31015 [Streptomyces dangxiongensis]